MADVKISALPAASSAAGTDELPANQSGTTRKVTVNQLFTTPVQQSYEDFGAIADPSAPGAGVLRIYAKNVSGRIVPKWVGPSGLDTIFQAGLSQNTVVMWLPGVSTTAAIAFGTSWTVGATQAHPAIATTNLMTSMKRATYTTTTTAANGAGIRSSAPVAVRGNAAGMGGFFFAARFGILTYSSTMRVWCGLSALSTALGATDPSGINDTIAMSKDTGETTWQVMARNTSSATKDSTGRTTAAAANAEIFDFYAFCPPDSSNITVRVVDIATGTVLIDNVSKTATLPTATAALYAHCECVNVAGGTVVAVFLSKLYVECDL